MFGKPKKMRDFDIDDKPTAGGGQKNEKDQTKTTKPKKTMGAYAAKKGFAGGIID